MEVTLLYFDDCPNWRTTYATLSRLSSECGFEVRYRRIADLDEAELYDFRGSPSVLVDGVDPLFEPDTPVGMSCRLYRGPSGPLGSPTEAMLREALCL